MNQKLCRIGRDREAKAGHQVHIISEAFACYLRSRGYATSTIGLYCRIVAHFERWLLKREVAPRQIRAPHVDGFLQQHLPRCHCDPPVVRNFSICRGALHGFLNFLRLERWIPDPPKRAPRLRAADRLLLEYDQHLDRVQGLSVLTRKARRRYAREWLDGQRGRQRLGLLTLKPGDLFRYVNARAKSLKGTSVHALAVGLRSFLRFLEFTGRIRPGLACAVPCPASPLFPPPTHILDPATRLRFLRSFDRTTPVGRRDYAIALCFSELALRANEVAALTLDDVDWRAMTVRLRQTKQRRERLLPLPSRVARALVKYLRRSRPAVGHRLLFISLRPPCGRPLLTDGVRNVIGRAFGRCGIKATGPHILRQSWATAAHQRGTDLKLIADVLGHGSVDTTAQYAKVHFEQLRQAALPWPHTPS
jgi:site-specific recombinase XerD